MTNSAGKPKLGAILMDIVDQVVTPPSPHPNEQVWSKIQNTIMLVVDDHKEWNPTKFSAWLLLFI